MRSVWKGTIGFGGYAIAVRAYSATEDRRGPLHQVHTADGGRIRYQRVCEVCGPGEEEVPAEEVGKGYALPGGDVVVLTEEELASLPLPTASSMEILGFVPPARIDPRYLIRTYYLEPEVVSTKPYVLLSEALQQAEKAALVKVAIRQRETLGALRVRDQVIMLDTLRRHDEVRTPDFPFLHEEVDLHLAQVRAAARLIENLAGDFDPARHGDESTAALTALIEAKVEGHEVVRPTAAAQDEGVEKLLAALQEGAHARTGEDRDGEAQDTSESVRKAKAAEDKAAGAASSAAKAAAKPGTAAKSRR
ncbi:Ku protein [Amycolatopsis cynarae]|uniref:Non-homologous end joining protein Ku n=1 Tax=Amycolatopsis cynarae TaxID=2995223 RepID=A0ABY7AWV8_9PSEU|nr:Ku protein [Amycolatopsis sp. HUAS 11-8]WAL64212.1 Ku protein [Amycolatopsis sp. HUAS 11-8]